MTHEQYVVLQHLFKRKKKDGIRLESLSADSHGCGISIRQLISSHL